jgi:hypothetical protein
MGGSDSNSRYRKHRKQNVRRMQNLQQRHSIGLYGKSLIPPLGTKFSWLERCPVTRIRKNPYNTCIRGAY